MLLTIEGKINVLLQELLEKNGQTYMSKALVMMILLHLDGLPNLRSGKYSMGMSNDIWLPGPVFILESVYLV